MISRSGKVAVWVLFGIPAALLLVGWVLLYSAVFNGLRSDLLEGALSEEIGQPVKIEGTVRVRPGRTLVVEMTDAVIPSSEMPEYPLSELARLSLRADLWGLLAGTADFSGLVVQGLTLNLIRTEDGRSTWALPEELESSGNEVVASGEGRYVGEVASDAVLQFLEAKTLLSFVLERSDLLSDLRVAIDDQKSGLVFDYALDEMTFDRPQGRQSVRLQSHGSVNGQPFTGSGEYNLEGPFSTRIDVGALALDFSGVDHPEQEGGGYSSQLLIKTSNTGDLLDLLKLERTLEGEGLLTADISEREDVVTVSDILMQLDFDSGRAFSASGSIGDFAALDAVDIALDLTLVSNPDALPPAETIADLKLTSVSGRIEGQGGALTIEDALLRSNAFSRGFADLGPVSVGRMRRTADDQLELLEISLQAGPVEAPYVQATGQVGNAMLLEDYAFQGSLNLPARLALTGVEPKDAEEFGYVAGSFALDDSAGVPQLRYFDLTTEDTDLWSLRAHAESNNQADSPSVTLDLGLDIAGESAFFETLDLPPIDLTSFGIDLGAQYDGNLLGTQVKMRAGDSDLSVDLALDSPQRDWRLRGDIQSATLLLDDLRGLIEGLEALSSLSDRTPGTTNETDTIPIQPLMLPEAEDTDTRSLEALLAEEGVAPLVIPDLDQPTLADLFDPDVVLRYMDVDIAILLERLAGIEGVTRIESALTASGGRAALAPIRFQYGMGSVDARLEMNVVDSPDQLRVTGTAGGWDLDDALALLDAPVSASGVLSGNFNLSGQYDSLERFFDTMRGQATLRMSGGMIATSLLDLAGLGVFPWLFSDELRQGRTTIACVVAPMRIANGSVSSDQAVLETNRVQLVTRGSLDWGRDRIDLRGEARPIGRPLARSAWPFDVSGALSSPDFSVLSGGVRVRREDGASTMPEARIPCVPDIAQLQAN